MIWGITHAEYEKRRKAKTKWHKWYAWHPVMLESGRYIWLTLLWRRLKYVRCYDGPVTTKHYRQSCEKGEYEDDT